MGGLDEEVRSAAIPTPCGPVCAPQHRLPRYETHLLWAGAGRTRSIESSSVLAGERRSCAVRGRAVGRGWLVTGSWSCWCSCSADGGRRLSGGGSEEGDRGLGRNRTRVSFSPPRRRYKGDDVGSEPGALDWHRRGIECVPPIQQRSIQSGARATGHLHEGPMAHLGYSLASWGLYRRSDPRNRYTGSMFIAWIGLNRVRMSCAQPVTC